MDDNVISQLLTTLLFIMVPICVILMIIFVVLQIKSKTENKPKVNKEDKTPSKKADSKVEKTANKTVTFAKNSIFDFMGFDKVEDNMIIQKDGKRFLMVIECQGVNYDLMSKMEKVAVEEGFQQFLNTLRHPIQIYIQTRTVNLEESINTYKSRVRQVEQDLEKMNYQYNQMKESGVYSQEELDSYFYEVTKKRNLAEYGKDIVADTERMSKNRNILNKRYYIVVPYYSEEAGTEKYDNEEIKNMAFSELYTKSQALISSLSATSVMGKILNSKELIELLYVTYNRDESEVFGIDRALRSGYEELYSTSMDVFEKKIKVLDEQIKENAIDMANKNLQIARSRQQEIAEEKVKNMDELIKKMAKVILEENKKYAGEEVTQMAVEQIEEGGAENEKTKKTTRRSKK